jgi:hypothetical protein
MCTSEHVRPEEEMDSDDLQPWQIERIQKALQPKLEYLTRLKSRMETVGFVANDPLYRLVKDARDAVQSLYVEIHYLSCNGGVGRRPKANSPPATSRTDQKLS